MNYMDVIEAHGIFRHIREIRKMMNRVREDSVRVIPGDFSFAISPDGHRVFNEMMLADFERTIQKHSERLRVLGIDPFCPETDAGYLSDPKRTNFNF